MGAGGTEEEIGKGIGGFGDIGIDKSGSVDGGMGGDRLGTDDGGTMRAEERGRTTSSGSELARAWGEGVV